MAKELGHDRDKEILYKMLREFDEYCKKNELKYFLFWGTLIGAVRHNGFIPWDDDVDIAMPRFDYNKLIDLSKNWNCSFDMLCYEKDNTYPLFFGKLSDKSSIIENEYIRDIKNLGLYIDVFPIDTIEISDKNVSKIQAKLMRNELLQKYASMKKFWPAQTTGKSLLKFTLYVFAKSFGTDYWQKKRIKFIDNLKDNNNSKYNKYCICGSWVLKREWLKNSVNLPFEESEFPCPKEYDDLLSYRYGNYMEWPPIEKRISQHDYKVLKSEE